MRNENLIILANSVAEIQGMPSLAGCIRTVADKDVERIADLTTDEVCKAINANAPSSFSAIKKELMRLERESPDFCKDIIKYLFTEKLIDETKAY